MTEKSKKILIISFAIIFILLVLFFALRLIYISDKININIYVVPNDSKIILNEKSYKNGDNYIYPGKYSLTISKDGFETINKNVELTKDGDQIIYGLSAISDEAIAWRDKNVSLYNRLDSIVDNNAITNSQDFLLKYPILGKLPYKNSIYSIGYKFSGSDLDNTKNIIITIHTSEQYRQDAFKQIERWGYNLTDFTYEISNYINPFEI